MGIVNSFFKVDGLDRAVRSFLIEGGGTTFQKAGGKNLLVFLQVGRFV